MSEQLLGRVKFFNDKKGFGFIRPDNGEDLFVHFSNINMDGRKTLSDNDRVQFIRVKTDRGWQAENVTVVDED